MEVSFPEIRIANYESMSLLGQCATDGLELYVGVAMCLYARHFAVVDLSIIFALYLLLLLHSTKALFCPNPTDSIVNHGP